MFEGKSILVTGGAGFVASNLLNRLVQYDCQITASLHQQPAQINHPNIHYQTCDLTQADDCRMLVEGIDYIFMCAANTSGAAVISKTPLEHVTPNVLMNTLLLDAAYQANVEKLLFISSNTVYPFVDHAVTESEGLSGEVYDKYYCVGWMKRYSEILCKMYSEKINHPMTTLIVRPANLYGPYDDFDLATAHVIPALINKVVARQSPLEVWGDGSEQKDLLYIDDFIDGLINTMAHCQQHDTFNLGSLTTVSVNQIIESLVELDHYQDANIQHNLSQPTMIPKRLLDCSKAQHQLNYQPKHSLQIGLQKTLKWYRDQLARSKP